jgi:DNA-directed RNA polymerase specialized sigma24 family protein
MTPAATDLSVTRSMTPLSKDTAMPRSKPTTMLVHPEFVSAITATLRRRGVRHQDLEDGVADVQVKMLEYFRTHAAPEGIAEWVKLGNAIAVAQAVDAHRKRKRRSKYDVDLCEDPDAYAGDAHDERLWDPVDQARLMDVLAATMKAAKVPEVAFMILDAEAAGTKLAEVAAELGLSESAVGKRLAVMQKGFRHRVLLAGLSSLTPRPQRMRDVRPRNGTRGK